MSVVHSVGRGLGWLGLALLGGLFGITIGFVVATQFLPNPETSDLADAIDVIGAGILIGLAVGAIGLPLTVSSVLRHTRRHRGSAPKEHMSATPPA